MESIVSSHQDCGRRTATQMSKRRLLLMLVWSIMFFESHGRYNAGHEGRKYSQEEVDWSRMVRIERARPGNAGRLPSKRVQKQFKESSTMRKSIHGASIDRVERQYVMKVKALTRTVDLPTKISMKRTLHSNHDFGAS